MLKIDGVTRRFGDVTALDGVSLEIGQGEFFALLGPSGCGKTTLLRIIAGFETPDSGTVTLDGDDLLAAPPNRRPISLMFQSYALFPHMTVARNVAYGLEQEKLPRQEIRKRVGEVLETVGLAEHGDRRPAQLSGGQRQRVALARSIVKRPRLLLLDEPLSALDKKVRADMQLELKRLQHEVGITFVVVTHDQEEAMSLADRIAVFHNGRVCQVDEPVALYERPRTPFVAGFVGASNLFEGTAGEGGGLSAGGFGVLPGTPLPDVVAGVEALLCVRPENITLTDADTDVPAADAAEVADDADAADADAADADAADADVADADVADVADVAGEDGRAGDSVGVGEGGGDGLLRGSVLDVSFYGGVSHLSIDVPGHPKPVLVAVQGADAVRPGAKVRLDWDAGDAVVIPRDTR
ncbi:ABC transporter ATP-binding protein [Nonomuraea indica]|uniref:ABC transporter ATP-binding protein n=1 Tax=Nonomuraea indica TaxID=1581193 RepID=A0ABW8AG69_9ACTN